jgi:hypothetical protein
LRCENLARSASRSRAILGSVPVFASGDAESDADDVETTPAPAGEINDDPTVGSLAAVVTAGQGGMSTVGKEGDVDIEIPTLEEATDADATAVDGVFVATASQAMSSGPDLQSKEFQKKFRLSLLTTAPRLCQPAVAQLKVCVPSVNATHMVVPHMTICKGLTTARHVARKRMQLQVCTANMCQEVGCLQTRFNGTDIKQSIVP